MDDFITIQPNIVSEETVINRSRFIGYCTGVDSIDRAVEFVKSIGKENYDATHNCYAYLLTNYSKFSDDGEPQGTAGLPILDCLKKSEIVNACVVVTRYFGGIKLGAGGLVRAYSQSAATVLAKAKKVQVLCCVCLSVVLSYGLHKAIGGKIASLCCQTSTEYSDCVTLSCAVKREQVEQVIQKITLLSAGKALVQIGEEVLVKQDV